MSHWLEVKACLAECPEDWSLWVDIFDRHGLPGTLQNDDPASLSAYIAPGDEAKLADLRQELLSAGAVEVLTNEVEETDWSEAWKEFFKPRRIGDHIVVCPSWEKFDPRPGDVVITLDPGQAFGTGDHPTTRGCLEQLEKEDLRGKRVADIGCGSGILSVGAMLLGAASAVAVDTDLPAVVATTDNAARNGVTVEAIRGEGFEPLEDRGSYDVVVSNIISAAIIRLAPSASKMVAKGGRWIVSGIILNNWPDVDQACQRHGFRLLECQVIGEWVAATYKH